MSRAGRLALLSVVPLVAALAGCGKTGHAREQGARADRSEWTTYHSRRWGYTVSFPPGWHRATRNLSPHITDPVEILTLATFPLRHEKELCGEGRGALGRVRPAGVLVTLEERGRGAYGGPDFPSRPARFRPDPKLPGTSEWPYCGVPNGEPKIPMLDYAFGFGDAGRAFQVLVAVGKSAPAGSRTDAFRILDTLRLDPSVKPTWRASS